jgi:GTP-binding protein
MKDGNHLIGEFKKDMSNQSRPVIAIIGRPNVGKSTLFNRLTGKRVAIIENLPGVTRDRIYGTCEWIGRTFDIIDTGGLEPESKDKMLSLMREQTKIALEEADGIIFLMDGQEGLVPSDYEVVELLRKTQKPVFYVVNKIDAPRHEEKTLEFYKLGIEKLYPISAEHSYKVDELLDDICQRFPFTEEAEEIDTEAIRVAVVGRPNVGKSSLVNYLLGEKRVLVNDEPGTTRDSIDTPVTINGRKYILIDTAGIRRKSRIDRAVERYSVVRALRSLERSDVVLVLMDAVEGITDQDVRIAGHVHEAGRGCVLVFNKWDLIEKDNETLGYYVGKVKDRFKYLDYALIIFVSALTGQRVFKIIELVDQAYAEYTKKVSTSELNEALESAIKNYQPPSFRGRHVKFFYITQVNIKPPSFILFCNYPEGIHFSYKRYLENRLREHFGFQGTPIRLIFRKRRD